MSHNGVTTILFWDIDGTLLTTGRAGSWHGRRPRARQPGIRWTSSNCAPPDSQILRSGDSSSNSWGLSSDPEPLARLVRRYEESLPDALPRRRGRVLVGVMELLQSVCDDRPEVGLYLLTGNTRAGAQAKLTYYGLFDFFVGGAFADPTGDRSDIARRALSEAKGKQSITLDRVFVIGDTPYDVACGRAIGARTVAVASGEHSVGELEAHGPWRTLPELPAAATFLAMLEESF